MINKNRKKKIKTSMTSLSWKQKLYIVLQQAHYKSKLITFILSSIVLLTTLIYILNFNTNLDNILPFATPDFYIIKNIFNIKEINILYFAIYGVSLGLSAILIYGYCQILRLLIKPLKLKQITQICKDLEIYYGQKSETNLPVPIVERKNKKDKKTTIMEMYSNGTTQEDWEKDNRLERFSKKFGHAVIGTEPHEKDFQKMNLYYRKDYSNEIIYWKDEYLIKDDCTFVLGENIKKEQETINLNDNAHCIIAGMSGSGKSVELMSLLMQGILKGNRVIIGEFSKGGVDYGKNWRNLKNCEVFTDIEKFLKLFQYELSHELYIRKELLNLYNCKNISEYNSKIETGEIKEEKLQRIIIALDEAGQIFIKLKDKEKEETLSKIRSKLNELFSTYRFCGVHAIFATQIPSATIFTEEVRYNSDRICGKANKILSEMAIDSQKASTINKKSKGHFFTSWGTDFQGYLFFEDKVFKNCPKKHETSNNEYTANN